MKIERDKGMTLADKVMEEDIDKQREAAVRESDEVGYELDTGRVIYYFVDGSQILDVEGQPLRVIKE